MDRAKFPKIEKMPADARALGVLRSQIIEGGISPGSRLTEIQISDEMGLSRATVRTALHQLAKEGLVSLTPYTGWTVVRLSAHDMWELYTLRGAVERLAANLAAQAGNKQGISDAYAVLSECCNTGDARTIAEADFAFHKSIVEAAGHGRLSQQYELIEQQIRVFIRSSNILIEDPQEILLQHQPLWDAVLAGDRSRAGDLYEQHSLLEGEKLVRSLSSISSET